MDWRRLNELNQIKGRDEEEYVPPIGHWVKEYKANKSHDCVRNDPYCPGEIREGEYYKREAILIREQGARGTVLVTKTCLVCQGGNR